MTDPAQQPCLGARGGDACGPDRRDTCASWGDPAMSRLRGMAIVPILTGWSSLLVGTLTDASWLTPCPTPKPVERHAAELTPTLLEGMAKRLAPVTAVLPQ